MASNAIILCVCGGPVSGLLYRLLSPDTFRAFTLSVLPKLATSAKSIDVVSSFTEHTLIQIQSKTLITMT